MSEVILFEIDNIDGVLSKYSNAILNRGRNIYKEGSVVDAYAIDIETACFSVKGTIDYTVVIRIQNDSVKLECNCPYFGDCKHEVAALYFLKEHPLLKVKNCPINMELNRLDEFKLEVQEQLYETECDDDFEDYTMDERLQGLYATIINEDDIETKLSMIFHLWRNFCINDDLWKYVMESYKQDPQTTKRVINNIEDYVYNSMIKELISVIEDENQNVYDELIQCLKEKQNELIPM